LVAEEDILREYGPLGFGTKNMQDGSFRTFGIILINMSHESCMCGMPEL